MLPDEVRKAVERFDSLMKFAGSENGSDWQTIRAHLLAREAEVERLTESLATVMTDSHDEILCLRGTADDLRASLDATRQRALKANDRAERAEALLREALPNLYDNARNDISNRITAHLSENSRG